MICPNLSPGYPAGTFGWALKPPGPKKIKNKKPLRAGNIELIRPSLWTAPHIQMKLILQHPMSAPWRALWPVFPKCQTSATFPRARSGKVQLSPGQLKTRPQVTSANSYSALLMQTEAGLGASGCHKTTRIQALSAIGGFWNRPWMTQLSCRAPVVDESSWPWAMSSGE